MNINVSDPIADMLTRIRNAGKQKHQTVDVPYSKVKNEIAKILLNEGYVANVEVAENGSHKTLRIELKYDSNKPVIQGLRRISKPGLRMYAEASELPRVLNGLGIAIISTSKGIVTDKEARKLNVGGEVMAYVW